MVTAQRNGDFARLNRALGRAGMRLDADLDVTTLLQLVGVLIGGGQDGGAGTAAIGRQLGKSIGHIPTDLILVGRALGLLDGITKQLDPELNAVEAIACHVPATDHPSGA
jgi:hypothetical protein